MKCKCDISHGSQEQDLENHLAWTLPIDVREVAGNDTGIIIDLLDLFRADTTSRLRTIREALAIPDLVALRAEIHTIRGAASQMGAYTMASMCKQIELAMQDAPLPQVAQTVEDLETHFKDISRVMALYSVPHSPSEAVSDG